MSQVILQPRWLSYEGAAAYSSLSKPLLEVLVRKRLIASKNVKMPEAGRGRRVIDRISLDSYIESCGDEAAPVNAPGKRHKKGGLK